MLRCAAELRGSLKLRVGEITTVLLALHSGHAAAATPFTDPELLLDSLTPAAKATLPRKDLPPLTQLPRYELELRVDKLLTSFAVDERISFTNPNRGRLPHLTLRLFANSTRSPPPIVFSNVSCAPRACQAVADGPSTIKILPARGIAPGETIEVSLHLEGKLHVTPAEQTTLAAQSLAGLNGLFGGSAQPTDYGILGNADGIASLGHCFAVVGRLGPNGFAKPEQSSLGDLGTDQMSFVRAKLRVPSDARVVATGVVRRDGVLDGVGYYTVSAGLVRDFALLLSRDFASSGRQVGDTLVRSHFLTRDRQKGEEALDFAAGALQVFQARFGGYPYKYLDVVEAPVVGGAGGVEFSGLVTVASMFYRSAPADTGLLGQLMAGLGQAQGSILEFTVAHEVAHQYWHGLVGSDSRQEPYLDESLAQFSALLYLEDRYGQARARQDRDRHVRMNYQAMRLLGKSDGPVSQPVDRFGDPLRYAGLVYGKGAGFFEAARALEGDAAFFAALQRYIARYRFRSATSSGLQAELARASAHRSELRQLARRWLEQSHGDEDWGKSDLASLLQGVSGGGGDLDGLLGSLSGGGGSGLDPAQLQQLLKGIDKKSVEDLLQLLQGGQALDF
jgi:hypothetical protein